VNSAVLKGMSAVVINFYLPCLLFSKTVPSFTSDNLLEIGVLILTAVFYQRIFLSSCGLNAVCGLVFALIVRCATPMRGWRNGVLFAGIFSNWGTTLSRGTKFTKPRRYPPRLHNHTYCHCSIHSPGSSPGNCIHFHNHGLVFSHNVPLGRVDARET